MSRCAGPVGLGRVLEVAWQAARWLVIYARGRFRVWYRVAGTTEIALLGILAVQVENPLPCLATVNFAAGGLACARCWCCQGVEQLPPYHTCSMLAALVGGLGQLLGEDGAAAARVNHLEQQLPHHTRPRVVGGDLGPVFCRSSSPNS